MTSSNVLPSAPELDPMNEIAQIKKAFRFKKIYDLQTELTNEANYCRQVAKKYKRTHSMAHISAVGLGSLSAGLSSATLATAVFGLVSAGFTVVSKRLERKVTKHENIYTLAAAKQNSVAELVSKALEDKRISDSEFTIILREAQKYHELKAVIRAGERKTKTENKEPQMPPLTNQKANFGKKSSKSFKKR